MVGNANEIVVHRTTKVNYLVAQDVHITHIESDVIVRVIVALNPALKMRVADAVFPDIANQPVQWNCLTQINNNGGMGSHVDEMMVPG